MRRRIFILAAVILAAVPEIQAQRPPNVVLIMMDDLGAWSCRRGRPCFAHHGSWPRRN